MMKFPSIAQIPPAFTGEDGMLLIGGMGVAALIDQAGDAPLLVHDAALLDARLASLRSVLPDRVGVEYAVRANGFAPLLRHLDGMVEGFAVTSSAELALALAAGVDPGRIGLGGAGKRDGDLLAALDHDVMLYLDSEGEADRLFALAAQRGRTPRVVIRVDPDDGEASPFGVAADRAAALAQRMIVAGAEWRGWQIGAGLAGERIALAGRLSEAVGAAPPLVKLCEGALGEVPAILSGSDFAAEMGEGLVAEAGVYLTRVIDVKWSQGETFLIVDGSLPEGPVAIANRFGEVASDRPVSLVGSGGRRVEGVMLPPVETGDIVAIFQAGAPGPGGAESVSQMLVTTAGDILLE